MKRRTAEPGSREPIEGRPRVSRRSWAFIVGIVAVAWALWLGSLLRDGAGALGSVIVATAGAVVVAVFLLWAFLRGDGYHLIGECERIEGKFVLREGESLVRLVGTPLAWRWGGLTLTDQRIFYEDAYRHRDHVHRLSINLAEVWSVEQAGRGAAAQIKEVFVLLASMAVSFFGSGGVVGFGSGDGVRIVMRTGEQYTFPVGYAEKVAREIEALRSRAGRTGASAGGARTLLTTTSGDNGATGPQRRVLRAGVAAPGTRRGRNRTAPTALALRR